MGWLIFSLADIRDDFFLAVALVQNILKQRKKRNRKTRQDMRGNDDCVRTFPFFMSFPLSCRISWLIFSLENYFDVSISPLGQDSVCIYFKPHVTELSHIT